MIDAEVAQYWRENFDLSHIIERDWAGLRELLDGKLHVYCGTMDNFYLNNAVYLPLPIHVFVQSGPLYIQSVRVTTDV